MAADQFSPLLSGRYFVYMRVMKALGQIDYPQVIPAKEWLQARRNQDGRWRGSNPFKSQTWSQSPDKEDTARWVTLHALDVLELD